MTVLIDVLAIVVGWTAVGALLLFVLDLRLLRDTAQGVVSILLWPIFLYHQVPSRRRSRHESRRLAAIRGHNDVVKAITSALGDMPETALLLHPLRARISAAIDSALDAAIDAANGGGTPRREYTGAFLSACAVVDRVFETAETAEAEGDQVSIPFAGDLLRALERSPLTGHAAVR